MIVVAVKIVLLGLAAWPTRCPAQTPPGNPPPSKVAPAAQAAGHKPLTPEQEKCLREAVELSRRVHDLNAAGQSREALPLAEKVAALRDPGLRARLIAEPPEDGHPLINSLVGAYHKMFELGDPPNYEPDPKDSLGARAEALGINPEELVYDALLGDDGRAFLYFPMLNYSEGNLDAVRAMLASPNTLSGLSDGGAHVGAICDVSLPTFMLTHWARDRVRGPKLDLAEIVRSQTKDTAEAVGLTDRGVLAPGYLADLNLIDFQLLSLRPPFMAYDLPTGARRLMQDAAGYVATIKSGQVIYRNGQPTGALPGRLVRGRRA